MYKLTSSHLYCNNSFRIGWSIIIANLKQSSPVEAWVYVIYFTAMFPSHVTSSSSGVFQVR